MGRTHYLGNAPSYKDNGDGTVADLHTGLMWQKTPSYKTLRFDEAAPACEGLRLGGMSDWRLPSIKELLSIALFEGSIHARRPYLDTTVFDFKYPDELGLQVREIDAQYWSADEYVGRHIDRRVAFGFNFADGRIKGYPVSRMARFARCVRGPAYGQNDFVDNGDGVIVDKATGLIWSKADSGRPMTREQALAYAESATVAGHSDWRLPNIKELHTIVDYTRAPKAKMRDRRGPAIDPVFDVAETESWFWSSTTHLEGNAGYYICFGRCTSGQQRRGEKVDIHGAGALRSDPKSGDPRSFQGGRGPQSDEVRVKNYVRLVRGGAAVPVPGENDRLKVGKPSGRRQHQGGHSVGREDGRSGGPGRQGNLHGRPRSQSRQPSVQQDMQQGSGTGQGSGRPPQGRNFMDDFDANGDGRVSRQEFHGPADHFTRFDKNGDGFVDETEAPQGPPK